MQSKNILLSIFSFFMLMFVPVYSHAEDGQVITVSEEDIAIESDAVAADAIASYEVTGSLFQQIIDLEQEKVLMELEKERAQLDLELDKLAAEKIKLHMEIEELSGRAEQQQQELANAQAQLEAEAARLEKEKEELEAQTEELALRASSNMQTSFSASSNKNNEDTINFDEQYRLVNVIGIGSQLQAKIENLSTGQTKTISVGKVLDGYTVQSISLDDGVVFYNGKDTQTLNITKSK